MLYIYIYIYVLWHILNTTLGKIREQVQMLLPRRPYSSLQSSTTTPDMWHKIIYPFAEKCKVSVSCSHGLLADRGFAGFADAVCVVCVAAWVEAVPYGSNEFLFSRACLTEWWLEDGTLWWLELTKNALLHVFRWCRDRATTHIS